MKRSLPMRLGPVALLLCIWAYMGCSDVRLQRVEEAPPEEFDNLLQIEGTFCTEPSGQITFPVKVLYILDQSASLQCLDSESRRFEALNSSINQLRRQPNTQFAFIGFSSWVRQQGFTRSLDAIAPFLDPAGGLGPATDYQGALATAVRMLERDMLDSDPMERARTRYIINFVSDGVPEPRCTAGCDSSRPPDSLYGVCNTTRNIPEGEYVELTPCQPYNQPEQIVRRVEEVLALKDIYGAGSVTMNTILLFSPTEVVEAICPGAAEQFGYDRGEASRLLRIMAQTGGGVFRDVNLALANDDYLRVDVASIKAEYTLANLFAFNRNARRTRDGLLPDSDGDGLPDALEIELGTDPYARDTDGDGYSDFFEHRFRSEGFDPRNPRAPAIVCGDSRDRDGDGLAVCEEEYLGTNPLNPDSDGDGVPDGIEFILGTDPLVSDMAMDPDFDGLLNIDEIRAGTDPMAEDEATYRSERVLTTIHDRGLMEIENPRNNRIEERRCYDFDLRRVGMAVTTLPREPGLNRVMIHTHERLAELGGNTGISKAACFESIYNGPRMKNPESGRIDVSQDALDIVHDRYYAQLNALATCPFFGFDPPAEEGGEEGDEEVRLPTRDELESAVTKCMPGRIRLDNQLFTRDQIFELFDRHIDSDARLRLPEQAHRLFVPLANLNTNRDCFRPWELERFQRFLDDLEEACGTCVVPDEP